MLGQGGDHEPGEVAASPCAGHGVRVPPIEKGAQAEMRAGRGMVVQRPFQRGQSREQDLSGIHAEKMHKTPQKRNPLSSAS